MPPPRGRVQPKPRPDRHHPHVRHARIGAARPLAQREVADLVTVGGEALREVAIPALGPADGMREQAVVDEADAHEAQPFTTAADTSLGQP